MTVDPWRVAQIAVERGQGKEGSRGSGYLIAPGRVLTAAHVVAGASAVRVRLDVGQGTQIDVQAENWWADPAGHEATDLAVITIPETATAGRTVELAQFGRISDSTAVLAVEAFGFPRFKLRARPANADRLVVMRDFEQVTGHAPVAANRRQGTLSVYLDDPPPRQPAQGEASPWEGMSGGPVLAAGRIVGVVAEQHPSEGTGRLTARRIDRAYGELPAADLGGLLELLGLTPSVDGLNDVVPREPEHLVRSAYLAQVRDIAPDVLIGREDELAEWAEFCAGPDAYAWWGARPWAGKSALASWFVLHPPAGVDVVSFFITGRLIGQADSDAFLTAMIEQLNGPYPAGGKTIAVAGARTGAWWDLLASAAVEAEGRGRRLVVVVDGLDEDEAGATPTRGRPSIASLLPRRPPSGVRFIVTSRLDPGIPDDLSADHPLRGCDPPRPLSVSEVAENIKLLAKQELRDLLAGDQVAIDVVGYIAASGGGLTREDLSALTGAPPHELDHVLRGVFGRSLYTRAYAEPGNPQANPVTRVYLFAHETLRVTAEEQLGHELTRYREKVYSWIESYARAGWPGTTPRYAIRGYTRLLVATADAIRLSALARDPRRHAFLLDVTGSDYTALTEIRTAQDLIAHQKDLDLQALVELAAYRVAIYSRNESIPADLAIMWAQLGRLDHAEALVRTIADPDRQSDALIDLAIAIAKSGDLDRAEAVARSITDPERQAEALTGLVAAVAEAGDRGRARQLAADTETLARTITDPDSRGWTLAALVTAVAAAGDLDRAEALARTIADPGRQARSLADLATVAARAGDVGRAQVLAGAIADLRRRARALASLATAIAQAGDRDRAYQLAADAEALARVTTNADRQADALTGLVTAAAGAGDLDRAEALARTVTDSAHQIDALMSLVTGAARAGDLDRAEALARKMPDRGSQAQALASLVTVVAGTGDRDRASQLVAEAEDLARSITDPGRRGWTLAGLVTAAAAAGDLDRAEALARTIADPDRLAWALTGLVTAIAAAGDLDRAEALARTIADPYLRALALARLVTVIAEAGDRGRASQLAADTETLARAVSDPPHQARALGSLTKAIIDAGDRGRASRLAADTEALANAIADPGSRAWALVGLVTAAAEAGDLDRAEALARSIDDPTSQAWALVGLATTAAGAGDLDRAENLARTVTDAHRQAQALTGLVAAVAAAGDLNRAGALARTIADPENRAEALIGLVTVAARAGDHIHAAHLLALVLVMDVPETFWISTVSRLFPSAVGKAWEILSGVFLAPGYDQL